MIAAADKVVKATVARTFLDYFLARCAVNFVPPIRLCTCTMNAMAKSGVAKLTIGIETNAAMTNPPA